MSGAPDGAKRIIAQHMAGQEPQTLFGLAASVPRSYLQRTNDAWNSGLDMANRGAEALQGGDLSGAAGMVLGPLGAVTAPITGIFPDAGFVEQGGKQLAQNIGADPKFGAATGLGLLAAAQTLMPTPSPAMFLGPMAKTADMAALKVAQEMKAAGHAPSDILDATGWHAGTDGKWRFEIDDSAAKLKDGLTPGSYHRQGDIYDHPQLYENYPHLADVEVNIRGGRGGSFGGGETPSITLGTGSNMPSVIAHENQHAVQYHEGFAPGSNNIFLKRGTPAWDIYLDRIKAIRTPRSLEDYAKSAGFDSVAEATPSYADYVKNARKPLTPELDRMAQESATQEAYRRSAGEVEARNVETRLGWDAQKRRDVGPEFSQDVQTSQQIVAPAQKMFSLQQAQPEAKKGVVTQSYKEIMPDGTERWAPGTLRVNPPKERFDPEMSPADVERYIQQHGEAPRAWPKGRIETASYKDHYPDGTSEWVPGLLRAKRPPR